MRKLLGMGCMLSLIILLAGCIKVELKDERTIPKLYEVVMITYTPSGTIQQESTTTTSPTSTRTLTQIPTASPSSTVEPTATQTPLSPTPDFSAMVMMNAFCRQGPGTYYLATSAVSGGAQVIIQGRNPEASWWLVQNQDGVVCWVSASVVRLPDNISGISVLSVPPTPRPTYTSPPLPTATRRPRHNSPATTETGNPSVTDTPNPYPYPAP